MVKRYTNADIKIYRYLRPPIKTICWKYDGVLKFYGAVLSNNAVSIVRFFPACSNCCAELIIKPSTFEVNMTRKWLIIIKIVLNSASGILPIWLLQKKPTKSKVFSSFQFYWLFVPGWYRTFCPDLLKVPSSNIDSKEAFGGW